MPAFKLRMEENVLHISSFGNTYGKLFFGNLLDSRYVQFEVYLTCGY